MSSNDKLNPPGLGGYTPVHRAIIENVEGIDGFVGLIDVLGFRELVGRDDQLAQIQYYVDTVASHLEDEKYSELQFVLFSDNLVINTRDDKRSSFITLVGACSDIFYDLARHQIAIRGTISQGRFMRSANTKQGVIVAGRPIVEADLYQHLQNWVGIMLGPSVVRRDSENLQNECGRIPSLEPGESESMWLERISLSLRLNKWAKIPFHTEGSSANRPYSGFAIVPMRPDVSTRQQVSESLGTTLQHLEMMKATGPNPASQEKYAETLQFLGSVQDVWNRLGTAGAQSIPPAH